MTRQQKITFGEMRSAGVRQVLIYCSDYQCGHCNIVADDADRWPDELRLQSGTFTILWPRVAAEWRSGRSAKAEIRAAVRYLLKGAAGSDRDDIVREIIAIVNEVAGGLPPGGDDPLDDGMPGG